MSNLCVCEISIVEDHRGHFVHITINGKLETTRGPFDKDNAYLIAKELARRAADTPKLVSATESRNDDADEGLPSSRPR